MPAPERAGARPMPTSSGPSLARHARRAFALACLAGACAAAGGAERFCDGPPSPIDVALERELAAAAGVTVDIRAAQSRASERWDKALNTTYRDLLAKLPPEGRPALIETQRAWLAYRDSETRFLWSAPMYGQEGSVGPIVVSDRARRTLAARVCELKTSLGYLSLNAPPPAKPASGAASAPR